MKKENELKQLKAIEELTHKNKLIQLDVKHKNRMREIHTEKEAKIYVELATHEHKMSFHRLKRADERLKKTNSWGERP